MGSTTLIPVEEYLRTSYPDGDREYVDGEVLQRNVGEVTHSDLQRRFIIFFWIHYRDYWVSPEPRVQVSQTRFRVHDVAVIPGPMPATSIIRTPPHIVIEVLSPDDRATYMHKKVADYLAFGIPYVWVIDPQTREAWIHTSHGMQPATDGVLRAQSPDIEVPLAELFA